MLLKDYPGKLQNSMFGNAANKLLSRIHMTNRKYLRPYRKPPTTAIIIGHQDWKIASGSGIPGGMPGIDGLDDIFIKDLMIS